MERRPLRPPGFAVTRSERGAAARGLLIALGAVLALALAAWGALAILLPPAKVRALVERQLGAIFAREVIYRDASVGLWPPVRLTVSELAIAEPGGFEQGTAVALPSLHLDLDVFALLGRKVVVRRVVLERPKLHLLLRPDGTTNLDGLTKPQPEDAKGGRPMDVEVRELSVRDGQVLVDAMGSRRRVTFGIGTKTSLKAEAGGTRFATAGETRVTGLAFGPLSAARLSDLDRSLAKLDWRLAHAGKFDAPTRRLALEKLALGFGGTEIALSGLVEDPGPRTRVDLKGRGAGVDLRQVMGFLAAADAKALNGIEAAGRLDFDLGVRGTMGAGSTPALTGTMRVADASFRYPGAAAHVEQLSFTARFVPDSLGIGDLRANVVGSGGATPVAAKLAVMRFADPLVSFAVAGDVDLAAVAPMVAPKDTRLGGRVALDVRGRGRAKDPGSLALDGTAKLANVSVEGAGLPKKVESVNGTVAFSPARAELRGFSAKAGQSSFSLAADVTRPLALLATPGSTAPAGVNFALESPHLDLAELLPTTPGAPLVPNATGGGTVRIARLKQQQLDVADVKANVALEPGVVAVPSFAFAGYQGLVSGNARFDLRDPAVPAYAVNARVDSVSADAILSAWTPLKGFFKGRVGSTIDLSGSGVTPDAIAKTLSAAGLAAFANGSVGPAPALEAIAKQLKLDGGRLTKVQDLQLPFRVERGRVLTDRARMRTPFGIWIVSGGAGFDGSLDYAVSATIPRGTIPAPEASTLLGVGALTDAQGNLLVDLRVGGSVKAPRVSLDLRATGDRVKGKVSEALTEQSDKMQQQLRDAAEARRKAAEDSLRAATQRARRALEDSLKRRAGGVLEGFFKPAPAPAAPTPTPAPAPAPADTTT